ncbi:hypothetical protein [Fibrobacter sp.]|uniref:hypothetical protein n=1 Tax=Fibrobacter sp. TaxID=35828 RepID=UPI0025C6B552|nr:hypothetical protein [Fibrobacter sp.]
MKFSLMSTSFALKSLAFSASLFAGMTLCGNAYAGETLFSNYVFAVGPAGQNGALWAFSRDGNYSGVTLLNFNVAGKGNVVTESTAQAQVETDTLTAVQDGIFEDDLAERRRIPAIYAGTKLGLVLPMFAMDKDERYRIPAGYYTVRDLKNVIENPLDVSPAADDLEKPMQYATSGFAYDSTAKRLWIARGALGVMVHDVSSNKGAKDTTFILNSTTKKLEILKNNTELDLEKNPEIFDVRLHPETGDLWLATAKGVWVKSSSGLKNISEKLKNSRVTGLWMGGSPLQIIAETSNKKEDDIVGGLWRIYGENAKDFSKVNFLDTAGKAQKKDVYDESDYTVGDVAFIGKTAYVLVRAVGGSVSGYLKLDSLGVKAWEKDEDGKLQWLYGYETGATDRKAIITSMCSFPLSKNRTGLALATYGNGVSVSADSGATWSVVLNRAKLSNNLGSIRMVPSVITPGDEALVSYKLDKESKITIEVFSYDMRKVRTIVKDAVRNADASRSSNPKEDYWDGRDEHGKDCTMGVYYIRVKDNHGHIGWGKAMTLGGNFR